MGRAKSYQTEGTSRFDRDEHSHLDRRDARIKNNNQIDNRDRGSYKDIKEVSTLADYLE